MSSLALQLLVKPPMSPAVVLGAPLVTDQPKVFFGRIRSDVARVKPRRSKEWGWRKANAERLRREFLGQWIVLEGEEIIATGSDPVPLVVEARRRGIRSPYIFRVEGEAGPRTSFLGA
jgi:hypothetical protein